MKLKMCCLMLLFAIILAITAPPMSLLNAVDYNGEFIYEELSDGTIWLKSYTGNAKELIIPETIDGKKVEILGSDGDSSAAHKSPGSFFTSADGAICENTSTVSITIPATVNRIKDGIFHNGLALKEINVDSENGSYTSQDGVLYDNDKKWIVAYPPGKTNDCIIVSDTVKRIFDWAFMNSKIEEVVLPNDISVGIGAFSDCYYLTSINTGELSELSDYVFHKCILLDNINISNATVIGSRAFLGCSSLTEITIPQNIQTIKTETFMDCTSLVTVNLPESLYKIEKKAFYNCSSLSNIVMPDNLRNIELSAFDNCASLTEINIPANFFQIEGSYYIAEDKNAVKTENFYIGYFNGCTSLKAINVEAGNRWYTSIDGVLYWTANKNERILLRYPAGKTQAKFYVPNDVDDLSYYAFSDCVNLKSIILPDELKYIHTTAFAGCTSLTSLIFPMNTDVYSDTQLDNYYYFGEKFESSSIDTIYGYVGSKIETFAKKNYKFVGLNSPSLIDEETKIILEGNPDNPLNDIMLNVVKEVALSTSTSETYNIALKDLNGNLVQPTNKVTVKMPIPTDYNVTDCNVYRKEANNRYTNMNAVHSDGYMVFDTNHFSEYIITTEQLIPEAVLGDVNGDGKVNGQDNILLNRYLANWGNEIDMAAADMNGDGKVNGQDSIILARTLAGWYD
ncbi:MAG: leucine-rich repeat protein [Eubacterium sp.]|nr:leucine-rich repeat protein [Eubacterium sp.]